MPTSTVENYVKQLYLLQQKQDLVPMGEFATAMRVVPGTATTMVKSLAKARLVRYEPRQGVCLTPSGQKLAMRILRRHRLVELLLVKVLGLDWSDVHVEAEELEHTISDRLLERIDEFLGRPTHDPHGDPIPDSAGKLPAQKLVSLADARPNERVVIKRIADQDAQFLKYANEKGLVPGVELSVVTVDDVGDSAIFSTRDGKQLTLGRVAAGKIFVTSLD
jgi:DtxR family Mn-dependent transcriptional regulator